ncbi:MAG: hypothetical protein ACPG40_12930 [Alphaproteobacteria bacterium]
MTFKNNTGLFGGLAVMLGLLMAPLAVSQGTQADLSKTKIGEEIFAVGDDYALGGNQGLAWALGRAIDVNEPTGGVFALGETITVDTQVAGPVVAAASKLAIKGDVSGSIYAAAENIVLDVAHTGGTILAASADTLEFSGFSAGSVYLYSATVRVAGQIDGDLYVGGDSLQIASDAIINGEIVYDMDTAANIPANLNSRGVTMEELQEKFGDEIGFDLSRDSSGVDFGGSLGFLIFSLVVGSLVLLVLGRQNDTFTRWTATKPLQTVATGFVGLSFWLGLTITSLVVVFSLAAGISWFLLILLVLVPVVMLGGFLLMVLGYFSGMLVLGSLVGRFLPIDGFSPFLKRLSMLVLAMIALFLVGLILPGLASLLGSVALILGLGALGMRIWKGQPALA